MANIKIRDLPLYSEADSNRSEEWLMVAQSGSQNGKKTVRISLDEIAPIDGLSGLIKNNRDNISVLSGNLNTVSGNVDTVEENLILTGQKLENSSSSNLLEFTTGLNPSDSSQSGYLVNGRYRENITLVRGEKYEIRANIPSCPLYFTKHAVGGGAALAQQISPPQDADGQNIAWGGPLMFFTVPDDISSNVFYQCYNKLNFGGKIHITNALIFDSDKDTSITLDNTGTSSFDTDTITMTASGQEVMSLNGSEAKIEKKLFIGDDSDISGNLRVRGDLTVNGGYTQIDTNVQTTEQMSITNDGTGPAIIANQKGAQPIINLQDDGSSVFFIDNGGLIGFGTESPEVALDIDTTDAIKLPAGTSAQRPTQAGSILSGMIRFNTESGIYEGYRDSEWKEMGGGGVIDEDKDTYITPESSADSDVLEFYTSGVKRAEISSSGNLSISGAALFHSTLDVSGAVSISGLVNIEDDLNVSGDIAAFYSTSDLNLKENISTIKDPIKKINEINGVRFNWKEGSDKKTGQDIGVIAQEVEKVIPEAVLTRKNGIKSVEYHKIIPLLIECIHNQEERIKELEKKCQYKA